MRPFVVATITFSSIAVLVACSPAVEPGSNASTCKGAAKKTAACRGTTAEPATTASAYTAPPVTAPPPGVAAADAGAFDSGLRKPDGNKPSLPPPNTACRSLGSCCQKIQSSIERAACMAVVFGAKPSTCATAVIGYQLLGCGHSPFSFGGGGGGFGNPNDDDGDGTPDFVDPDSEADVTLQEYCVAYPEDEVCGVVSSGGEGGYDTDPCVLNPNNFECSDDPFATDPDFGDYDPSDPYGPPDPYDPYGPPDPYDPYGPPDPYDPYADPGDPYYPSDDGDGSSGDDGWYP